MPKVGSMSNGGVPVLYLPGGDRRFPPPNRYRPGGGGGGGKSEQAERGMPAAAGSPAGPEQGYNPTTRELEL